VIGAGQDGDGFSPSPTLTVKLHWAEPAALVAVQVTVVEPRPKLESLAGEQLTLSAQDASGDP
jgi:hypothetical protein